MYLGSIGKFEYPLHALYRVHTLLATSCLVLFQLSQPHANIWKATVVNFAVPYWSLSVALNILLTLLIVGRFIYARKLVRRTLGPQHGKAYTTVVAMLVESAAIYSVTGLAYIICYAVKTPAQELFVALLGQFQVGSYLVGLF